MVHSAIEVHGEFYKYLPNRREARDIIAISNPEIKADQNSILTRARIDGLPLTYPSSPTYPYIKRFIKKYVKEAPDLEISAAIVNIYSRISGYNLLITMMPSFYPRIITFFMHSIGKFYSQDIEILGTSLYNRDVKLENIRIKRVYRSYTIDVEDSEQSDYRILGILYQIEKQKRVKTSVKVMSLYPINQKFLVIRTLSILAIKGLYNGFHESDLNTMLSAVALKYEEAKEKVRNIVRQFNMDLQEDSLGEFGLENFIISPPFYYLVKLWNILLHQEKIVRSPSRIESELKEREIFIFLHLKDLICDLFREILKMKVHQFFKSGYKLSLDKPLNSLSEILNKFIELINSHVNCENVSEILRKELEVENEKTVREFTYALRRKILDIILVGIILPHIIGEVYILL